MASAQSSSSIERGAVLYLVGEDWAFLQQRLPMALAAQRAGHPIHLATRVNADAGTIEALNVSVHPLPWRRGSFNPIQLARTLLAIRALYKELSPSIVHHIGLQAVVLGSLAAIGTGVTCVNSILGLGSTFTSDAASARAIRSVLPPLMRVLLNRSRSLVSVENADDRKVLESFGVEAGKIVILPGSGVNTRKFLPLPEPDTPLTAAFVGRLVDDKGVRTLIAAHDILVGRNQNLRLLIAGQPDPANPSSVSAQDLEAWKRRPGIEFLGHVQDINQVWSRAHIAVLPSRREGLPISLLEASACARALVATDVPGCREIARTNVNALLVPVDDATALADALWSLACNADLRRSFGIAGRKIVETEYSDKIVGEEIVALYNRASGIGCRKDLSQKYLSK